MAPDKGGCRILSGHANLFSGLLSFNWARVAGVTVLLKFCNLLQ